jgi:acyl-CoA thioester hydrolase
LGLLGDVFEPHRHRHRVTYSECTIGNHVYYGRYLEFLEEARGAFFRSLGTSMLELQAQSVIFPVVECRLKYAGPARYDEDLMIEMWVVELERVRLTIGHRILRTDADKVLAAETVHACTNLEDKPRRIPDELRSRLASQVRP